MGYLQAAALARPAAGWSPASPGRAPAPSIAGPWGQASSPPGTAQRLRARACAAELVLLHRLRARVGGPQAAGMREHAARVIELTARLWLA
jgi:hypothetical protein